jgi:hypothetical protein
MPLAFPTKPSLDGLNRPPSLGEPARARACWCPNAWLDEPGSCCRCGHLTEAAIRATWSEQARRISVKDADPVPARVPALVVGWNPT